MDIRKEIKTIIFQRGTTLKEVCEKLEHPKNKKVSPNNITNKLRLKTIKFTEDLDILDILGYHFELVENE